MEKYRYVWLNIETGEFSDSWGEEDHQKYIEHFGVIDRVKKDSPHGKLIKYSCLTDEDFEFYRQMKLK